MAGLLKEILFGALVRHKNGIRNTKVRAKPWLFLLFVFLFTIHYSNPACASSESDNQKSKSISVDITTHLGDNQTFVDGDVVSFFIGLDQDAYVLIIYRDAQNHLIQLIPNDKQNTNFYQAGDFIAIPDKKTGFQFKISAPYGKETLWAFASNAPLPALKGSPLNNGLRLLSEEFHAIRSKLANHARTAQNAYGEAETHIYTKSR